MGGSLSRRYVVVGRRAGRSLVRTVRRYYDNLLQHRMLLPAILVIVCLAVPTGVGWNIHLSRQAAERAALNASQNLVALVARDVENKVAVFDIYLRGLVATFPGDGPLVWSRSRHEIILELARELPELGAIVILDPEGRPVEAIPPLQARNALAAGNPLPAWFTELVTGQRRELYVGAPEQSLTGDGPAMALSRRIEGPNGDFRGVAMIELHISFFDRLVSKVELGREGVIWAAWANRTIIIRRPSVGDRGDTGVDVSRSPNWSYFAADGRGSYTAISAIDRIKRLYAFERIDPLPISIAVGESVSEVFAEWRLRSAVSILLTAALWCALLGVAILIRREAIQRNRVEEKLLLQSETDTLTGLANRRRFEKTIEIEIRRAQRNRTPVSVLMIDVDKFKLLNDRLGHSFGDEVLRVVAERLQSAIKRPGDLAARVGGDEFAILLPATSSGGALKVAEAARSAVEAHRFPDGSGTTITIGVATADDLDALSTPNLIRCADQALYAAKDAGRNRVAGMICSGGRCATVDLAALQTFDEVPQTGGDALTGRGAAQVEFREREA